MANMDGFSICSSCFVIVAVLFNTKTNLDNFWYGHKHEVYNLYKLNYAFKVSGNEVAKIIKI